MSTSDVPQETLPTAPTFRRRNLNRGRACRRCRIRKSRCDGKHPSCSQCLRRTRGGVPVECIYEKVSETRKQTLEDTIQRLEDRINHLESLEPDEDAVILQPVPTITPSSPTLVPSSTSDLDSTYSGTSSFDPTVLESLISSCGSCVNVSPKSSYEASSVGETFHEEPTRDLAVKLIQSFLPHAASFGFFLDIPRFCESAALALPLGHYSRPFPGLLSTVYLLGFYLSNPSPETDADFSHLSRALLHVANAVSTPHPMHVLHGVQAEILLSMYFFYTGRIAEGKYHMNSAVSLALCSGYHKLGSKKLDIFTEDLRIASTQLGLITPSKSVPLIDVIDEEVKIQAFWMTLALANCWGVAMGSVPSMVFECHGETIDTPWPGKNCELADSLSVISVSSKSHATVQAFLNRVPATSLSLTAPSVLELYAKSSILLERATDVAASYCSDLLSDEGRHFWKLFTSVDSLISDWAKELIPISQTLYSTSPDFPLILATHTITNVATINLHAHLGVTSIKSREKALGAARRCVELVIQARNMLDGVLSVVNPFFGPMWTAVCQIFIKEIGRPPSGTLEELPSSSVWGAVQSSRSLSKKELVRMLEQMFEVMGVFAMTCPLIKYQLFKLKNTYRLST